MTRETPIGRVGLAALFVTALVTAQLTASKVLAMPFSVPYATLFVPGGVLAYALTFFATDCYAELYGRREAQLLVNLGFAMMVVMLGLVWFAILMPAAPPGVTVPPSTFRTALGSSTSIVAGSLAAYVVSQNWDVYVFHRIREYTDGRHLWLRNVGSTATSQLLDTAIFIGVGFGLAPLLLRGAEIQPELLAGLALGQYLVKLLIAFGDTPLVYLVTRYLRETELVATPQYAD